ncbi:MAG TPA: cytochrome ubiquinol oxidase subunit I [Woeseiaceae bacterium]|nr:cytochrome ubiquinol oxidase subunit I [Woeseiaceae bacterium]
MDVPDAFLLSRIQFAANISFHILFPMVTIALAWILLFFKIRYHRSGDIKWMNAYRLWVKIFALSFALGVVSGITMSFQFGTNWPGFMNTVGNIAGPLLAYEVLTAFFLEATFLGIMLFGFKRVSNGAHTVATALVAFGTTVSAFWILALNSWMHTPAGFVVVDGVVQVTDWMAAIFNPSLPYRLLHTVTASVLTASFLLAGISAYRWRRGDRTPAVRATMRTGVFLAAVCAPLQIFFGDLHGLNTLAYQPAKIAAIEGLWQSRAGAPLLLFAVPDAESRGNHFELQVPRGAAWILTHDGDGYLQGIDAFPGEHPPVGPVFWAFRIMVGTGLLMVFVSLAAALALRGSADPPAWLSRILAGMTFAGWIAVLSGWYTTEIGRQPYLVSKLLLTRDAVSGVPPASIAVTLAGYLALYAVLITAYVSVVFYLARQAGAAAAKTAAPRAYGESPLIPAADAHG